MSVFAQQPVPIAPPSYPSIRHQPPAYKSSCPPKPKSILKRTPSTPLFLNPFTRSHTSASPSKASTEPKSSVQISAALPTYKREPSPLPRCSPPPYNPADDPSNASLFTPVSSWKTPFFKKGQTSNKPKDNAKSKDEREKEAALKRASSEEDEVEVMKEEDRRREGKGEEEEESEWCWGCFWVGPPQPWIAYYVF